MSVKARWPGATDAPTVQGDPFEGIPEDAEVERDDPREHLARLMDRETVLLNRGISCPVRDREDTSCCACPKRGRVKGLEVLCDVGATSERIITELAVERLLEGR